MKPFLFTQEEKVANLRKGVQALRDNPKKAKDEMLDHLGGRCCLCVLANVAEDLTDNTRGSLCGDVLPAFNLNDVFAFHGDFNGGPAFNLKDPKLNLFVSATSLNDGTNHVAERTHAEIADMIEEQILNQL